MLDGCKSLKNISNIKTLVKLKKLNLSDTDIATLS